ncbi:DUF6480 family protein [Kitasatospora sp. NPDC052896]|uniref:DUF6480 family protein n=1 Tax=Kitasatospora sp. NPDC052896 TaxID=3364061 RepID=UPI0037CAA340
MTPTDPAARPEQAAPARPEQVTPAKPARPPGVPPTETPEGEGSTTHGISIPEPPELHDAWPSWIPMALIALLVVAVLIFMIARITSS